MNKNTITIKNALNTGLFLGGMVFFMPSLGAEIEFYESPIKHPYKQEPKLDFIDTPTVSFNCNTETKISVITQNDAEVLNDFAGSLLKGMKNLDYDISRWVDDNFWDLV